MEIFNDLLISDLFKLIIVVAMFVFQIVLFKKQFVEEKRKSVFKKFGLISLVGMVCFLGFITFMQYKSWLADPVSKYLLPPNSDWLFFIKYSFTRFWFPYVFSFLVASIVFLVIKYFNKKYEERFFYKEEPWIIAISIFLTGHPGWLVYIVSILAISWAVSLLNFIKKGKEARFSPYYVWLSAAFLTILISKWLITVLPWLLVLKMGYT